jgi:hypothetical protein
MQARTLSMVIVACTFAAAHAHAQTLSFAPTTEPAVAGARAAVAIDLNRDGWTDVVTANATTNRVVLLLNGARAGGFLAPRQITVPAGPFDVAVGDLDRDGIVDLVVASPDAPAITVLFLRSDASLRARLTVSTAASHSVAVADWTRDGVLDVVYSDSVNRRIGVLPGNGTGGFGAPLGWAVTMQPRGVLVDDFNHDGFPDIAVANATGTSLTVLEGTPAAATIRRRTYSVGRSHHTLEAADINADGWTDLAAVSPDTNRVTFLRGSPTGFVLAGSSATGPSPRDIAAKDFNHDGRPDLAVANNGGSSVTVLLAPRDGSVLPTHFGDLPAASGAHAIVAADFDHDGRNDMAAAAQLAPSLTVFRNDTAFVPAAFSFVRRDFGGFVNGRTVAADFNENGIPDPIADDTVLLDGETRVEIDADSNHASTDVATADINRDGHADAVIVTQVFEPGSPASQEGVDLYYGDGRGAFTFVQRFEPPRAATARVADVNRDGRPDIVVGGLHAIHVFVQGATGFERRDSPLGESAFTFELADTTRDGVLDVVAYRPFVQNLAIYRGDGTGRFVFSHEFGPGVGGLEFSVTDLNHDGRFDVALYSPGRLTVILATGNTSWQSPVHYPVPSNDQDDGATFADFNHDGHIDAFTWAGELLPGIGDGTFGPPALFAIAPRGAAAVDLNRDGLLDVVTVRQAAINERRAQNRRPIANAGPNLRLRYHEQFFFEDGGPLPLGLSTDPDLHRLTEVWRYADGSSPFDQFGRFRPRPPGTYTIILTVDDGRGGTSSDPMQLTVTPTSEIVMHSFAVPSGNWQSVSDPTAASGVRMFYPNAGAARVERPAAEPGNYVELSFTPDPTQTYKLWFRMKAQNNHWANDSIWVQFSSAVDAAGRPNYRIGTTEGLSINLEECSNCGVAGWGWEDDGWGAVNRNGTVLRFPDGGVQTIRIQVREDGVSFDQIVLSAVTYRTERPGTAKNDTTILPMRP